MKQMSKRSYVSQKVSGMPPSGIRKFFDIAATMDDVISLGIGQPDFVTPDAVLNAGIESLRSGRTSYTSNSGIFELREAIAGYLNRLYGITYHPEDELLVTVGVSEAMFLAMHAILDDGDEVLIPEPSFVSYAPSVVMAGGKAVHIPTHVEDSFQVTGAALEAAITGQTRAILIGYPNNPTGAVMTREMLLDVAAIAQKHDLIVVSDEIYSRLVYDFDHVCFSTLPGMKERTILLNGFSKSHAMTGWRMGFVAAPREMLAAMRKVHQYLIMSAPTTGQDALIAALDAAEDDVESMRQEYDRRRRLIVGGFNELGLPTFEPRGAFYAFPSVVNSGMDDVSFAETLLQEEQVAVIPGSAFGESGTGFVRCAYATSYEEIEEALVRMRRFMQRHG